MIASGQMGRYDVPASVLHEMYIVAFLLMLLAFWRHRANIKRLATGTENKIEFGKNRRYLGMAKVSVVGAGAGEPRLQCYYVIMDMIQCFGHTEKNRQRN